MRRESLQGYLAARMRGVGPARAREMLSRWGCDGALGLLRAPAEEAEAGLRQLSGVGAATARKLKAGWDAGEGTCAFAFFWDPIYLGFYLVPLHAHRIPVMLQACWTLAWKCACPAPPLELLGAQIRIFGPKNGCGWGEERVAVRS